jgi:hypothetical protein
MHNFPWIEKSMSINVFAILTQLSYCLFNLLFRCLLDIMSKLIGNVPKELSKLRCLKILNLAMNILTRELLNQLGNLGYLLLVNIAHNKVNHNKLKGKTPIGGIFNSLNMTSLEGKYRRMWIRSECFMSHGYA